MLLGRRPNPLQIQTLLFPPPHFQHFPWPLFFCQTQAHNGPSCNIFCYCVLVMGDVRLRLLQPRLRHRIPHRGVNPASTPPLPRLPSRQPAGHLVMESSQHPLHKRRHDSCLLPVYQDRCLLPVYQDRLHHRQVNLYQ